MARAGLRESALAVGASVLDYILCTRDKQEKGRSQAILEIQGGGESSATGKITRHVEEWAAKKGTNSMLREPITGPGIIPNNAWKRQLEQIFRKVPIARRFGAGFALVMGEVLYDYVTKILEVEGSYADDWEIALFSVAENKGTQPGPLAITSVAEARFLSFNTFIEAIRSFPLPVDLSDPFLETFRTFTNEEFIRTEDS